MRSLGLEFTGSLNHDGPNDENGRILPDCADAFPILKTRVLFRGPHVRPSVGMDCILPVDLDQRMSALGHKRTFAVQKGMSALPPKADIGWRIEYGSFHLI